MNQLTAFQRDILYAINKHGEPYGLTIKNELETYYDSEVNHGRLYPNLDELADRGFLVKSQKDKRTNEYQLTDQAYDAMQKRRKWENIDDSH